MATEVLKRLINVEEYYKMAEAGILKPGDRVELIYGEIYEMSPVGSKHGGVVKKLAKLLNNLFGDKIIIGVQDPVRIDLNNEPEPDISVLKYKEDFYSSAHPGPNDVLVIIEVADSSIKHDREVKKPLYASCGVQIYWIIDVENRKIEVYTNPKEDLYLEESTYKSGDTLRLLDQVVQVRDLFPE